MHFCHPCLAGVLICRSICQGCSMTLPTNTSLALPKRTCASCYADATSCCSAAAGAAVEAVLSAEADSAAAAASSNGMPQQSQQQEHESAVQSAAASLGNVRSSAQAPLDVAAITQGKAHWLYLVHPEVPQAGQAATVLFNRSVSEVLRWGATPATAAAKSAPPRPPFTHTFPILATTKLPLSSTPHMHVVDVWAATP